MQPSTQPQGPKHLIDQKVLVIMANGKEFKCTITSVSLKCMWFKDIETGNTCTLSLKIWDQNNHQSTVLGRNIRLPNWVSLIWKKPTKTT